MTTELTPEIKDQLFAEAMRRPLRVQDFIVQSNTADPGYGAWVLETFGS
jgi:hypothetical protein